MRKQLITISTLLLCKNCLSQNLKPEDTFDKYFCVLGFDSPFPLSFQKGDTINLNNGLEFEAFFFNKNGKLQMVESYQWCGTTVFLRD